MERETANERMRERRIEDKHRLVVRGKKKGEETKKKQSVGSSGLSLRAVGGEGRMHYTYACMARA